MQVLRQRIQRAKGRVVNKTSDINRAFRWHALGGKQHFQRYVPEIVRSHRWCFICGCNNSGTSLLQSILDKTGQTSALQFEGQHYTNTLVRGSRRGYERVWSEFIDELRLDATDSKECVPRLIHDWMAEFSLPIHKLVVEKTTMNAVRMLWLQSVFPNSYFIGLVRNGYAVAEGIRRKGNKSVERGARHWSMVNKIMLEDVNKLDHYLQVSYEELVDKPAESARKIGRFLELDLSNIEKSVHGKYGFNTVLGDQPQPIRNMNKECIARLSQQDLQSIKAEAGGMLEYFSY